MFSLLFARKIPDRARRDKRGKDLVHGRFGSISRSTKPKFPFFRYGESSTKRLAVSLVFAAVILVPAMSFGQQDQPGPTTKIVPCDAAYKHEDCLSKWTQFAQMACHGALKGHQNRCIRRAESKCVKQCMRGLVSRHYS